MPFCRECGKEVQEDWSTCPFCSSSLVEISQNFTLHDSALEMRDLVNNTTINDPEAIKEGFKKALIETEKEALEREEEMKRVEEQKKKDAKRRLNKKFLMEYKSSLDHLPFRRIELERNHIDEGKRLKKLEKRLKKLKKSFEKSVLICFSVLFLSIFLILNLFFHWSTFPFQIIFSSILAIFLSSIIVTMFNDEYRSKEFWKYNSVFKIWETENKNWETEYKNKLSDIENQKLLLTQSIIDLERELSDEL